MSTRRSFLAGLVLCPICSGKVFAEQAHWGYEAGHGPEVWSKLDKAFSACSVGDQQSPVDLSGSVKADLPDLGLDWTPQAYAIANNGQTILSGRCARQLLEARWRDLWAGPISFPYAERTCLRRQAQRDGSAFRPRQRQGSIGGRRHVDESRQAERIFRRGHGLGAEKGRPAECAGADRSQSLSSLRSPFLPL